MVIDGFPKNIKIISMLGGQRSSNYEILTQNIVVSVLG